MTPKEIDAVMSDLFDTHSFNEYGDWRTDPVTSVDPIDDEEEEGKIEKYSDDQERDDHGRFSGLGGEGGRLTTGELNARIFGIQIGPDGTKYPKSHYNAMKRIVKEELVNEGMTGQAVEFVFGEGKEIAGIPGFKEAGHFDPRTGHIQLNLDELGGNQDGVFHPGLRATVRHEATHVRFNYALTKGPLVETGDTQVGNFIFKNIDALEKEDGTTAYSKVWWDRAKNPETWVGLYRRDAVNESLAEMHAHYPFISFSPPTYRALNVLVDAAWKSRKPKN